VIDRGDLEIQYCPTERMWADVLTKPKQGTSFRRDRSYLMNIPEDYDDSAERARTHQLLLPKNEREDSGCERPKAPAPCRSVLEHKQIRGDITPRENIPRGQKGQLTVCPSTSFRIGNRILNGQEETRVEIPSSTRGRPSGQRGPNGRTCARAKTRGHTERVGRPSARMHTGAPPKQ